MSEVKIDRNDPNVVYDIRNDSLLLSQISAASLSTGRLGLAVENGVVGSSQWWDAVRLGSIKIQRFVGKIQQVDRGMNGDSSIVRIEGDREMKSWVAWDGFRSEYIGRTVEVAYSLVAPKFPPRPGFMVELILKVQIIDDESARGITRLYST